jgi:hypothetical protein
MIPKGKSCNLTIWIKYEINWKFLEYDGFWQPPELLRTALTLLQKGGASWRDMKNLFGIYEVKWQKISAKREAWGIRCELTTKHIHANYIVKQAGSTMSVRRNESPKHGGVVELIQASEQFYSTKSKSHGQNYIDSQNKKPGSQGYLYDLFIIIQLMYLIITVS